MNLDDAGDNPFFLGHHEGPALGKTRFPSISAKNPMDSIHWTIRRYFPGLTPYMKDWLWKSMEQDGLIEKAGKAGFEGELQRYIEKFQETNLKVIDDHIKKVGG